MTCKCPKGWPRLTIYDTEVCRQVIEAAQHYEPAASVKNGRIELDAALAALERAVALAVLEKVAIEVENLAHIPVEYEDENDNSFLALKLTEVEDVHERWIRALKAEIEASDA